MNDNNFEVMGSENAIKDFLKSAINSSETVIDHYDFVINDISSNISDKHLESSKGPTVDFLNKMRNNWLNFKNKCEMQLKDLKK